ncbi:MAG: tetratricopeptide repeat protein, partial [Kiritimatiellae bacterium]|nr:tetratricopeptide repeat protein [Kiritimatiellia bacterium]
MKTPDGKEIDQAATAVTGGPDAGAPEVEMDEAWERPVVMAKDRNVRAWLIFLGLVCLGVALWTPLRALYYRYGYKQEEVAMTRDADTFLAVAYYGVNSDAGPGSQDVTTADFEQHLRLLRERGYTPIGLADVRAFYKEGKLLPRKAVLMTFEQSRKSSYFEIRKLLHNHKWKAVMGVVTAPIHERDAQALLWPYLRDMVTVGYWDLAAQSERGFEFIETSPSGKKGPYLASPMWKSDETRYELPEEFNSRVAEDHAKVISEFQKEVGFKPVAFFFPYGDYGQYEEQAKVVRVTNLHQVGTNYELGFILGQLALNSRESDPRRLNRLLVNPAWTPLEFVNKLDSFWPLDPSQDGYDRGYGAERWIGEWGGVSVRENELVLRAIPPVNPVLTPNQAPSASTAGAKAWLAGSDTFKDGFISVRFQIKRGRFGVYLRSTHVGSYVYFSLDDAGRVSVRQRLPDMDELVLATDGLVGEVSSSHELLLSVRDNLLFVRLDGKTLFGGRIFLRGEDRPGMIAAGVWDRVPGIAEAVVMETRLFGRRDALVTWTPDVAKDIGYLTMWLNEHGYQFNVLSPPWLDIFQNTPITFPIWDREALGLLVKANEMRVLPQVLIRDASLLLKISAAELAEKAQEHKCQGIYVDTSGCSPEQVTPLVTWLIKLNEALQAKDMRMILTLPVSIETLPSAGNILKLLPGVVLAGKFQRPPFGLKDSEVMGITHVVPSVGDETLSLYYQLSDMLSVYDDVSPDAKKEELRQSGFDAFTAGDYEAAIRLWQKWADEDSRNAEALALIGDAWLRLNDRQKALEYYTYSLDINPGQMNLAIRQSRLLEDMNRLEESAKMLNAYARAFPDSPSLTIAQAQWLDRNRQRKEARNVMKGLVGRHPENIEARLILQTLLDESTERYANMQDLLAIGRGAETHLFGFGRDIFAA